MHIAQALHYLSIGDAIEIWILEATFISNQKISLLNCTSFVLAPLKFEHFRASTFWHLICINFLQLCRFCIFLCFLGQICIKFISTLMLVRWDLMHILVRRGPRYKVLYTMPQFEDKEFSLLSTFFMSTEQG